MTLLETVQALDAPYVVRLPRETLIGLFNAGALELRDGEDFFRYGGHLVCFL